MNILGIFQVRYVMDLSSSCVDGIHSQLGLQESAHSLVSEENDKKTSVAHEAVNLKINVIVISFENLGLKNKGI